MKAGAMIVLTLAMLAQPARATGQAVLNYGAMDASRRSIAHLHAGFEYGFVAGVGYSRNFPTRGRNLLLSAMVTAPWADADAHDYGARIAATREVAGNERWRLIGGIGGSVRGTANELSRLTSLGADGVLLGGYWTPRWFVAGEGGYDNALATHVDHTDEYRSKYHAEARDGWYRDTGANIRVGIAGGVSFGGYDVVLRAGRARDRGGRAQLMPGYVTLGWNLRL